MLGHKAISEEPLSSITAAAPSNPRGSSLGHGALGESAISEVPLEEAPTDTTIPPDRFRRFARQFQPPHPSLLRGRVKRRGARLVDWQEFSQVYQDGFRVADASLDRYELYAGVDTPPDFDASGQPVATNPTLPVMWTPPTPPSSGEILYLVTRKRNKYGLLSFNVFPTLVALDSLGAEDLGPVSAPFSVNVIDGETGYLRVIASYSGSEDRNPADYWEVYVKFGSDPVAGVDTPVYDEPMVLAGLSAGLAVDVGPYTPGTTARVLVVARRDFDDERGIASVVQKVLAENLDLEEGQMFGGNVYEQR